MVSLITAAILVIGQYAHKILPIILPTASFLGYVELFK